MQETSTRVSKDSITWWGIGLSILAANIAYDYIHVGASLGYTKGLAIGSYEWTGSLLMIFVLLFIFPEMMSTGVKTTPEYLGLRFNLLARRSIAVVMVFLHIFVVMVPVLYSASLALTNWYGLSYSIWLLLCVFVITSILLSQNIVFLMRINIVLISLMIIAGLGVMIYCFYIVGGLNKFVTLGAPRINAFLASDDNVLPWHSVIFGGLWIAHAYYWSYNQFIQQYITSSNTLSKAQFGFLLTASIKLIIPFIILVPGITLFILNKGNPLANAEDAFSLFIGILPNAIDGVILIIYLSTLLATFSSIGFSSINLVLNDLISDNLKSKQSEKKLYRLILVLFMSISFLVAYFFKPLGDLGLMHYNQLIMNATTPTIVSIFTLGIFFRFITAFASNVAIFAGIPIFIILRLLMPDLDMLNTGGIVFLFQCFLMTMISYFSPEKELKKMRIAREIRFERNLIVVIWSIILITVILAIYAILM